MSALRVLKSSAIRTKTFHTCSTSFVHYLNADEAKFKELATTPSEKLAILDFYADWCGPCKVLTPLLKKVIPDNDPKYDLITINVDDQPDIAAQFRVSAMPTVVALKPGETPKALTGFVGAQPEPGIKKFLEAAEAERIK